MRTHSLVALAGALLLSACAVNPVVQTEAAPGFSVAGRSTFHILPVPPPADGVTLGEDDPMLVNSITNRALRSDIEQALSARGYRAADAGTPADFDVASYASANRALDINTFDYGYTWRGRGVAAVSEDPQRFLADMDRVVNDVLKRLPPAGSR